MLTGELRSQINAIWDSFWSGGISNPLEVMEQITYLLFIRRLDDKRQLLLSEDKIGLYHLSGVPQQLSEQDHAKNNLPDVLARWARRNDASEGGERQRPRTAQSFCVPKADIAAQGYDLSINRYKEVVHAVVEHESPQAILARLAVLEEEIQAGMKALEGVLA